MRKYIFLDIDGVIATKYEVIQLTEFTMSYSFTDENIKHLYRILEEVPESLIVIQSSWKDMYPTFEDLKYQFKLRKFKYLDRIIGATKTIRLEDGSPAYRGLDVREWLIENAYPINKEFNLSSYSSELDTPLPFGYVILDDAESYLYSQQYNFIHVNRKYGLTNDIATDAINILNNVPVYRYLNSHY